MGKLEGLQFWEKTLHGAKLVVAPMVDQSELAWRMLSRIYGAQLCYTPMYHASVFVRDATYRTEALASCPEDRPLIVQFCCNDPDTFLQAAKMAEDYCDAIDLNLGCPQSIAKRGHYGAFLEDEWELLQKMVSLCHKHLKVPITCKIRVFDDLEKTLKYAKMLESAGCQLLTVHGRTKEQKGPKTGLANWSYIKAVREAVSIPVFANGNIQYLSDIDRCLKETGVHGVMSAEGNLHNPALFSGLQPKVWDMVDEYLDLVEKYPCPMSYIRGHLFKLCHHALLVHTDVREKFASTRSLKEAREANAQLREKAQEDVSTYESNPGSWTGTLPFPYWICQPYVRPDPVDESKPNPNKEKRAFEIPEGMDPEDVDRLSRNKLKKLKRNPNKSFIPKTDKFAKCVGCGNPRQGAKCSFDLCRTCCKTKSIQDLQVCQSHNRFMKQKKNGETKQDTVKGFVSVKINKQATESKTMDGNGVDNT